MITRSYLKHLVEQKRVSSVRVVPVPLEEAWCIDVIVREPLEAGSRLDTVASSVETAPADRLQRFQSIDAAAHFLREIGVRTFTVDTADAISFVQADSGAARVVEHTLRLWNAPSADEGEQDDAAARVA